MTTNNKPKTKKNYIIKLEVMVPAVLHFKILASSPEEALEQINKLAPIQIKPDIKRRRNLKATVCESGYSSILHRKTYSR